LHPAQITLNVDAFIIPILHPRKVGFYLHRRMSVN